jgi:hypothetical protein
LMKGARHTVRRSVIVLFALSASLIAVVDIPAQLQAAAARTTNQTQPARPPTSHCLGSPTHGMNGPGWGWVGTGGVRAISAWWGRRANLSVGGLRADYVQKVLWQIRRSLRHVVTLRGWNLPTRMPIRFRFADQGPGTQPIGNVAHLDPRYPNAMSSSARDRAWLGYSSEILLPSLGCYVLRATWDTGAWVVTFIA